MSDLPPKTRKTSRRLDAFVALMTLSSVNRQGSCFSTIGSRGSLGLNK